MTKYDDALKSQLEEYEDRQTVKYLNIKWYWYTFFCVMFILICLFSFYWRVWDSAIYATPTNEIEHVMKIGAIFSKWVVGIMSGCMAIVAYILSMVALVSKDQRI